MNPRIPAAVVLQALVAVAAAETSEPMAAPALGDRIRLQTFDWASGDSMTGVVVAVDGEGLEVQRSGKPVPTRVKWIQMETLAVSRGQGTSSGSLAGAGFVVFALAGLEGTPCYVLRTTAACSPSIPYRALSTGLIGMAAGAVIGMAVPAERWEPVRLKKRKVTLGLQPGLDGGGAGVRLHLRF